MIHFVVTAAQDHSIRDYLTRPGSGLEGRVDVLHYEDLPDRPRFERGAYILSALEYLSAPMLSFVAALHQQLADVAGFRFLNHPTRTLRRYELLRELARQGLNPFRAVRAGGSLSELRYPVFLRGRNSHDGAVSPLLRSPREVDAAIGRALLAGRRLEDLLVVEFCDTADGEGWYRKHAAFVIGDNIVARRMDRGRAWMLKREHADHSAAMGLEELEYVRANPHARELREIADLAAVGYGCIDYAVKDGRVVVWEINLAPTMGRARSGVPRPKVPEYGRIRAQTGEVYHPRLRRAFEELDVPAEGAAVAVDVDSALVLAARAAVNVVPEGGRGLARLLEPARPVIEPVAAPFLPLLGRMARRRAGAGRGRSGRGPGRV